VEDLIQALSDADPYHSVRLIRGERVDNLYERDIAEKAEIDLLMKVAKSGVESFSLAWWIVDRQWQIVAFVE